MSFTPGPNTMLATALAANFGMRRAWRFIVAVPTGWTLMMIACGLGLGALVFALPWLRGGVKAIGVAYLVWLAWKLANTRALAPAAAARMQVGFWQGVALQFVNIKAWMLALALAAGWVATSAGQASSNPGERLAIVCAVMAVFALSSNAAVCAGRLAAAALARRERPAALVQPRDGAAAARDRGVDGADMSAERRLRAASDATPVLASRAGGAALAGPAVPTPWMAAPSTADETRGLWFGLLGVVIFAMTTPMTRLAVGTGERPAARAALRRRRPAPRWPACSAWPICSLTGAPRPLRRHATALAVCAAGTVVGFPLFLGLALRDVDAMHGAVITGVLPLGTAVVAALAFRQRPSTGFWVCAGIGCALVLAFAAIRGGGRLRAGRRPAAAGGR